MSDVGKMEFQITVCIDQGLLLKWRRNIPYLRTVEIGGCNVLVKVTIKSGNPIYLNVHR
jgi:hypothetical protein